MKFFKFTRYQFKGHAPDPKDDDGPQFIHLLVGVGPVLVEAQNEIDYSEDQILGSFTHIQVSSDFGVQVTETVEQVMAIFQTGTKEDPGSGGYKIDMDQS